MLEAQSDDQLTLVNENHMNTDPNPQAPSIPDEKGTPSSRIKNSYQVYEICKELEQADSKRSKKRDRIFKAYNRFPPSDYSTLFEQGSEWQSNVNFGMMAYVIDNNMSSYYDMLTERVQCAQIVTKWGKPRERHDFSEKISQGFDKVMREWPDFLLNAEQDLLDMLLFSKGVQVWDDEEGCTSEHIPADYLLVPDGTKVSLTNFDQFAIKRKYSLHELWCKIESGGEGRGWSRNAVLNAMKYQREAWSKKYKTTEDFSQAIASGEVNLGAHLKEHVDTYTLYIREFKDKSISKFVVLRDYKPAFSLTRGSAASKEDHQREVINREGFLFQRVSYEDDVRNILAVFIDQAGAGFWHRLTSLGEKIFVQCRQYDFIMNAVMDAVKINMSLMLQAQTEDAAEKIKALVWGPYTIIPTDVPFVQQRMALPTQEATATVQFMMLDMFRGIGEYRISERSSNGGPVTATQNMNDTAEAAKLSGTQLKRYNEQHTQYYRTFYKKLVGLKRGEKDYEMLEKFKDFLDENGVPAEAWKWENIESITSTMLAGAGSPSYKLQAAEKTIALTNISPKDEGQAHAVEDAIAALHGRSNVRRYINQVQPEPTINEQKAGWENEMLGNPLVNPSDMRVMPDDNHVYHVGVHLGDMERVISLVNEGIEKGKITPFVAEHAAHRLLNQGMHVMAHFEFLQRDEMKSKMLDQAKAQLNEIQRAADKMQQNMQAAIQQQNQEFDPSTDPEIAKKMALNQLEVQQAERLMNIKAAGNANSHAQKAEIDREKAANEIAIKRANAAADIEIKKASAASEAARGEPKAKKKQ